MSGAQLSTVLIIGIIAAAIVLCHFADAIGRHKDSSKEGTA